MIKLINILYVTSILSILCLTSWEIYVVSHYQNTELNITHEYQKYDYVYITSVINLVNSLLLIWIFVDIQNERIINYLIFLTILNFIMGLWCCKLYVHHIHHSNFNIVLTIELILFIIKCIILLIYILYRLLNNVFKKNIDEDIKQNLISN